MATTQLFDVVIPEEFTAYQVENPPVSTGRFRSGVPVNDEMLHVYPSQSPSIAEEGRDLLIKKLLVGRACTGSGGVAP